MDYVSYLRFACVDLMMDDFIKLEIPLGYSLSSEEPILPDSSEISSNGYLRYHYVITFKEIEKDKQKENQMSLSERRISELERSERKLLALEEGGVDNWEGYDSAIGDWKKENELQDQIEELLCLIQGHLGGGAFEPSERGAGYAFTDESINNARDEIQKFVNKLEAK